MSQDNNSTTRQADDLRQAWDLSRTSGLVENFFGPKQRELVQPCLRSIVDRQRFAQYHYTETKRLLSDFQTNFLQSRVLLEVVHGEDEAATMEFERLMVKAGAHVTACIQAMHAVPDILASCVYFALGLNLQDNALADWKVNISSVREIIEKEPDDLGLAALLKEVISGDTYAHVAAVSNLSKHRSVIRASLSMDLTGTRERLYEFHISSFDKQTAASVKNFPSISLADLLEDEFTRVGKLVIRVGDKVNEALDRITPGIQTRAQ